MCLFCRRIWLTLAITAMLAPSVKSEERDYSADLPTPLTIALSVDSETFDGLADSPVKPRPYQWMVDDPVTPTSPPTVSQFGMYDDDVEPYDILERPGIPAGWIFNLELTAASPYLSSVSQSGSAVAPPVPNPISPPVAPLDWTLMPRFTVGYRQAEGLGEWSASYRFLISQGTANIAPFAGGLGTVSSNLQFHVMDIDYTLTELLPHDLWLVPSQVRVTGGVRVAGTDSKSTASGGSIINQFASNTFAGAGPRFAMETTCPIACCCGPFSYFARLDAAGIIGSDWQKFSQQLVTDPLPAASSRQATIGVPVLELRAGMNWLPDWGSGNVKLSAGYQWERWFEVGSTTTSFNELTIQGPYLRGEVAF